MIYLIIIITLKLYYNQQIISHFHLIKILLLNYQMYDFHFKLIIYLNIDNLDFIHHHPNIMVYNYLNFVIYFILFNQFFIILSYMFLLIFLFHSIIFLIILKMYNHFHYFINMYMLLFINK